MSNRSSWLERISGVLARGPLLALVVALLAHGWGIPGGFVLDDRPAVLEHPVVNGAAPLSALLDYNHLGERLDGSYSGPTLRPVATALFRLQYAAFGRSAPPYHLVSLLLYLLTLIVAHRLFRRLGVPEGQASFAVALFAVLAIHVEVTASVANTSETLVLLTSLSALELALRGGGRALVASALMLLLALGSKESAALTPLLLAWFFWARGELRGAKLPLGLFVGLTVASLLLRAQLVPLSVAGITNGADNVLLGAGLGERLWMPLVLLGRYLALTLLPLGLAADYSYGSMVAEVNLADPHGWLGSGLVVCLLWGILAQLRGPAPRLLAAAAGAFAISYALASNTVWLITILFAERLFLAPSLWLCLLLTLALGRVAEVAPRLRSLAMPALALFVVSQVWLSASRCLDWRDEVTLLRAQVRSEPESLKGRLYLARQLARRDPAGALWQLGVAAAGRRAFPRPWRAPRPALLPAPTSAEARQRRLVYLLRLPRLIAPEASPSRVWMGLAAQARRLLGPGPAAVARRLLRASAAQRQRGQQREERQGPAGG